MRSLALLGACLLACATPPPATDPAHSAALGECQEQARADRREWRTQRWSEVAMWTGGGSALGALAGLGSGFSLDASGQGAALGAAAGAGLGLLIGVVTTQVGASQRYQQQVDQCLYERGYAVRWR